MIRHRIDRDLYLREVAGNGSASSRAMIVYVHGLGESGLGFEPLMRHPRLVGWRQLAADMPGYGKSPWHDEPLGLEAHADNLAEILAWWMEVEAAPGVVVVGHSMGGVIGVDLCRRLGSRVRGFLNVEGNVSLYDCGFSSRAAACSEEEFLAEGFDRMLDELYLDGREDRALRTYYPSMRLCDPRAYYRNSRELVEVSRREGQAAAMAALEVPCLYVLGRPGGAGTESQALLDAAGVSWRAVEGAGHWPFLDQTTAFVDTLAAFLEDLRAGPAG